MISKAILLILVIFVETCNAFQIFPVKPVSRLKLGAVGEEPDLFEYFDPLLSPHSYPNGISPNNKPTSKQSDKNGEGHDSRKKLDDDDSVPRKKDQSMFSTNDYFDPLLSPHMYPNGTPDRVIGDSSVEIPTQSAEPDSGSSSFSQPDQTSLFASGTKNSELEDSCLLENPNPDYFDPTISPHCYPNGTPDRFLDEKETVSKKRIGVLLIDHGSRNESSNERLKELARLYHSYSSDRGNNAIIVQAAHMELATPSIPEGLKALLDQQVEEIVCHPYFLSANGRHVSEDIPTIIADAIASLDISIPVVTTEPVGSMTDMMLGAIESLVQKNSNVLSDEKLG